MSYTKGPWYADSNGAVWRRPISDLYENGGTHAGDHPLARVFRGNHDWENGFPADANARLIAAAPDLLEALQELFADYKDLSDCGDFGLWRIEDQDPGKKAMAAIAKAKGEGK